MNIVNKLLRHELITGSFYIFLGTMFSNVLAFILNLFLARNLSYADYAIFASLLSVFALASIPAGSINTIIVKFAIDYHAKNEVEKAKSLYVKFFKYILGFSGLVLLSFSILSISISSFLRLDNIWYVVLVGFIIAFSYLGVLNTAFLQSLLKFSFISFLTSISGIVKLLVGILLVYLGFGAFGGIWAIFSMILASFLISFIPLRNVLKAKISGNISFRSSGIVSYAIPTFFIVLFLTSFTSIDVILVKHFFNPHLAGFYAGLSLVGKVIFYFTGPIPMVMFPLIVKRHAAGKNFVNLFYLSLFLVLLPSVSITLFYFLFPNFVINLFLGGREYLQVSGYLGIFGIYITVFSLINICVSFFLSLNKTKISYLVVTAAILQIILIYLFHNSFYQVILVSLVVSIILLMALLALFFKSYGSVTKIKETASFLNTPLV